MPLLEIDLDNRAPTRVQLEDCELMVFPDDPHIRCVMHEIVAGLFARLFVLRAYSIEVRVAYAHLLLMPGEAKQLEMMVVGSVTIGRFSEDVAYFIRAASQCKEGLEEWTYQVAKGKRLDLFVLNDSVTVEHDEVYEEHVRDDSHEDVSIVSVELQPAIVERVHPCDEETANALHAGGHGTHG